MTTNINISVDVPRSYNIAKLKQQLLEYAQHLIALANPKHDVEVISSPRKVEISSKIRSLSGRYPVPEDFDYKTLLASEREADYYKQETK